jgi:eukaryotic-like serine/threonine-protein kinase
MKTINDVLKQASLERLRRSYSESRTGRGLVFFVGSGLSRSAGLPDWNDLADKLMVECKDIVYHNAISEQKLSSLYHAAKSEKNLWKKFEYIKEITGKTTFSSSVKSILSTDGLQIPNTYNVLCNIDVSGFISLNIDDFLLRSMQNNFNSPVYPVYGRDASDRLSELTRNRPYLYQPHGSLLSESSWVFTESDFNELCQSPLHEAFLSAMFLRDTVVFIGISAKDCGASLRLANLNNKNLRSLAHFWIASNSHIEDRSWAEENGIQTIFYPAGLGHDFCISEILKSIKEFKSVDSLINIPVVGNINTSLDNINVSPEDLFKFDDIDQIRITLNAIIKSKSGDGEISYEDYSEICRKYARAIHSCYMMPSGDVDDKWFGYKITGKALGGKTIGRIMPAVDMLGRPVAVKILDQRRYSDELYLSAFRRGIKALKILKDRNIEGTVSVYDAYEVPPTIVMDYLNCASLDQAVASGKLSPVNSLRVIRFASKTILEAHLLPEIVLHRDIRPSNILLEGFDWDSGSFDKVNVIDFDLAWHKGALGDDFIRSDRDSLGYQAPEQLSKGESSRRRTTLIDSYGLGATLYFCVSSSAPELGIHRDSDWIVSVKKVTARKFRENREIVYFISNLITSSMSDDVAKRISVSEIRDRLDDVIFWLENETDSCSMDFSAEMLCALSAPDRYDVDPRRKIFSFNTLTGLSTSIQYIFLDNVFEISFNYLKPGNVDNGRADKVLNKLKDEFSDIFKHLSPIRCKFGFSGSREFNAKVLLGSSIKTDIYNVSNKIKNLIKILNIV